MVQASTFGFPRPSDGDPSFDEVGSQAADSLDALLSENSGTTAPAYKVEGTRWLDKSVSPARPKRWDGTQWVHALEQPPVSLHGDSNFTMTAADLYAVPNVSFTAARTWTLPAASTVPAGLPLVIDDIGGRIQSGVPLEIAPHAGDTIAGSSDSIYLAKRARMRLISDGTSAWSFSAEGNMVSHLLYEQTFSNDDAAFADLAPYLARGYRTFEIDFEDLIPEVDLDSFYFLASDDGGTPLEGAISYQSTTGWSDGTVESGGIVAGDSGDIGPLASNSFPSQVFVEAGLTEAGNMWFVSEASALSAIGGDPYFSGVIAQGTILAAVNLFGLAFSGGLIASGRMKIYAST